MILGLSLSPPNALVSEAIRVEAAVVVVAEVVVAVLVALGMTGTGEAVVEGEGVDLSQPGYQSWSFSAGRQFFWKIVWKFFL